MNAVGGDGDETSSEPKLPPPSLVPRLHAVVIYNLKHNNPHLPANINSSVREKGKDKIACREISTNTALIIGYTSLRMLLYISNRCL